MAQVEAGPQGGHHIWVAVRMKNLLQSGSITSITGHFDDPKLDVGPFQVIFTFDSDEGNYCKLYGLRFQLDQATDIQSLLGKTVKITVKVTDKDGTVGVERGSSSSPTPSSSLDRHLRRAGSPRREPAPGQQAESASASSAWSRAARFSSGRLPDSARAVAFCQEEEPLQHPRGEPCLLLGAVLAQTLEGQLLVGEEQAIELPRRARLEPQAGPSRGRAPRGIVLGGGERRPSSIVRDTRRRSSGRSAARRARPASASICAAGFDELRAPESRVHRGAGHRRGVTAAGMRSGGGAASSPAGASLGGGAGSGASPLGGRGDGLSSNGMRGDGLSSNGMRAGAGSRAGARGSAPGAGASAIAARARGRGARRLSGSPRTSIAAKPGPARRPIAARPASPAPSTAAPPRARPRRDPRPIHSSASFTPKRGPSSSSGAGGEPRAGIQSSASERPSDQRISCATRTRGAGRRRAMRAKGRSASAIAGPAWGEDASAT